MANNDPIIHEDGVEWWRLKEAAEDVGQKKRNVQLWAKPPKGKPKVASRQFEERTNAPLYVDIEALREFTADRPTEEKGAFLVPVEVMDRLNDISDELRRESNERVKAETKEEFLREQVRMKDDRIKELEWELLVKQTDEPVMDTAITEQALDEQESNVAVVSTPLPLLSLDFPAMNGTQRKVGRFRHFFFGNLT